MASQDFKRKLTAILSADVKGYSRLMRDDEEATVRTITTYRELIGSVVRKHRGEVVDSPGDNILAEFASVVDAVRGAVEIQEELKVRNAELPENRRMEFRIGINLGDVIHEEKRIYGDGVNVAARVESLADAGGICVSRSVFNQVKDKLNLGYENLGEHSVKNIAEPVRVYRVLMDPEAAGKVIGEKRVEAKHGQRVALAAVVVLILIVGGVLVWRTASPPVEVASIEKMAFPLPDKPSIAVLPFVNMSGDPEQEYFSDGLTEEITTALSRVPKVFVIARNSTFTYKGKPVKVQQVSEELGVKYVLEGSVRKAGGKIRITAQLIDAFNGHHLWAERYDRNIDDIFAVQDEITKNIITAMQVKLTEGEQARAAAKGTKNLDAYLKYLQARNYFHKLNSESNALAKQLAEEAIALDPNYAWAFYILGRTHMVDVWLTSSKSPKDSIEKSRELAKKAIALDDSLAEAYALLSYLFTMTRQHDEAVIQAEKAVALNPNSADLHYRLGKVLIFVGRWEESIPEYKIAIRLDPIPQNYYLWSLGYAYAWTGQYDEAIKWCEKAVRQQPDDIFARIMMAVVYVFSGRDDEARVEASEVLRINPKFSLEKFAKRVTYKNQEDKERAIDALRKAGLPESPPLPLPDKPSIAVLPFENMSDDPKQEYFSDGITDDLITDLSKISGLFVIARNSTFTYKGKPVKVQQVARDLGVLYVLEGSVRKAGEKIRLNAQLIDATTGNHLWAERYDGNLGDIFALQDKFTRKIVSALAIKLTAGEEESVTRKYTDNITAYGAYLQGLEHHRRMTREDMAKAVPFLEKAIELDPNFGQAHTILAAVYQASLVTGWHRELGWPNARSLRDKYLGLAMENPTAETHAIIATKHVWKRQHEKAVAEAEQAIALDPNSAENNYVAGIAFLYAGRSAEAVDFLKRAMRVDPHYPVNRLHFLGLAQFCLGQFEEALITLESAHARKPKFGEWPLWATYAHLGREQEAADLLAETMKRKGSTAGLPAENLLKYYPFRDSKDADRFIGGLLKAGLPRPWNPVYRGHYDEAITRAEQAIGLNPNDAEAQFTMGETQIYAGRSAEAVEFIKRAMELNPEYPPHYLWYLGLAQFCLEQYQEALTSFEEYYKRKSRPVFLVPKWLLAATYAQLGRQQDARETLSKFMKSRGYYKAYSVEKVLKDNYYAFKSQENKDRLAEGLRKAGLPME